MITAALFDMDGLMIDSDQLISEAYEKVLEEYGIKPKKTNRGFVHTSGISAVDNWKNLVMEYSIDENLNVLASKKAKFHEELIKNGVKSMPGLQKLLILLKNKNIRMAVASSSKRNVIQNVVEHLDIQSYFEIIVSGEDVVNGKPAPDIFLECCNLLMIQPSEAIGIEDAVAGIKAIKSCNMYAIGIGNKKILSEADDVYLNTREISFKKIMQNMELKIMTSTNKNSKTMFEIHPWKIVQIGLKEKLHENLNSESIFSLGNEYMGTRGTFEESYSGETHLGCYVGGV
jgi:HAD superfamily hydrolase (TIGR01509 family)